MAVAGQRVAVNVCYEDAYGAEIIRQLPEATLLVNVSNVAWFGDSLAPAQHLQIARMRALETGRVYLTAANTGITAAIWPDGSVRQRMPQFVAADASTSRCAATAARRPTCASATGRRSCSRCWRWRSSRCAGAPGKIRARCSPSSSSSSA